MIVRQTYINGKDSVTIRMFYNNNRIIEKFAEVRRLDDYEKDEYILPEIQVATKQFDKILRNIKKQNIHILEDESNE